MHILLIEDDPMMGRSLSQSLQDTDATVDWRKDGISGETAIANGEYSLIVLDLGLPDKSGLDLLSALRIRGNRTPVLIVTARDQVDDRVKGLDLGADDYLVKPFGLKELLARIRAIIRRNEDSGSSIVSNGETTLNFATQEASYRGKTMILPAREFALLHALLERPGTILSKSQIESHLYQYNMEVKSNAIEVLIYYLRKKFDNDIIRNVRGVGWMMIKHPQ
ncbi:MAG: response regulator transcription factor [Burkholderiales bacterium]|nr:response regulator transcription factor [Burkholderiales bacterium]MDE2432366.1 response regulator transcription factor [Burkholderiales bacterium]